MDEPAINPIVDFKNVDDFVVWGAKTLPREPVAMDRVGVRRLCVYLEKYVRKIIYEEVNLKQSLSESLEIAIPKVEQFLEDCRLRKAYIYFTMGTFRTEDNCEINIKFKQRPELEEITLVLSIY